MENTGGKPAERDFMQLLRAKWDERKFVCVGLDSKYKKLPPHIREKVEREFGTSRIRGVGQLEFNQQIVRATSDLVCAYKINSAFYEELGSGGLDSERNIAAFILEHAPDVPIVWDGKRGDIGNTNDGYTEAMDQIGADAVTVHNYMGRKAMKPFLDRPHKGVIVLCRTSNDGAEEFQNLPVLWDPNVDFPDILDVNAQHIPLYQVVAHHMHDWNYNGNVGVVAGATNPDDVREIRKIVGDDMPILLPGFGAQQADLEAAILAGINSKGKGIIANSSRGIIFASAGTDFAEVARAETLKLHNAITACLAGRGGAA